MDSEGDDEFYYSDDDDVEDSGREEEEEEEKHYIIVKEEENKKLQENYITEVCSVLSVSRSVACTLLCQANWTTTSVYDKWFSTIDDPHEPVSKPISSSQICKICCETIAVENEKMLSAGCGHLFCVECWRSYISISIQDGPGCLTLPCPEHGCESHPGIDMVDALASRDEKDKYYRYLYRSYVESNRKKRKWCPAPGCEFAIEFVADVGERKSYEVTCDCGYKLCWNCGGDESHSPLDCKTVAKWTAKNKSEAENTNWILAYTKPCPKCRRPIEKNQGCNVMTCGQPCGFRFCWLCLQPHGYAHCNGYKDDGGVRLDKESRMKAKKLLERYTHYYERWDSSDKSRKRALADLITARDKHVYRLAETQKETQAQLKFVVEAWEQIAECRRVLKWTYAYGYYLSPGGSRAKIKFFEHLQGRRSLPWKGFTTVLRRRWISTCRPIVLWRILMFFARSWQV